jgi:hypothetical protein
MVTYRSPLVTLLEIDLKLNGATAPRKKKGTTMRIVWTNFEKQLVSDSMVHFLVEHPSMTNKQVFASAQQALPYERRGKVTDQRVFSYKARINEARAAADKIIADRKKVVAAKPPEPPAPEPVRKLDTLGEVFELFIDALADRIIDKMIKAKQQVEERVEPELKHDDLLDATFFGGRLMDQLKGLSIRKTPVKNRTTVLVVGLNGCQMETIRTFKPDLDYTFVTAEKAVSMHTFNKDHTFLMTKFINHSVQAKYRKHPNLHYCNGGVSDLKHLLKVVFHKETA